MSRRRALLGGGILVLSLGGFWLGRTPVGAALIKSKQDFAPLAADSRVRFEPGAEEMARSIAAFLDTAIATVESAQGAPFREAFTVYVCATQGSLNAFIGLPSGAPIRGMVRFGEVFIAPSAFDWQGQDVHRESLMHEMSHLHLRQRVGVVADRGRMPPWFKEALADLVSGAGGEGISRQEAVAAILEGPALRPDSTGRLWSLQRAGSYGLPGPMLHRQSRMFLDFLRARDPVGFPGFILRIQEERSFSGPFREHFGGSVEDLWAAFVASLRTEGRDGVDR